MRPIVRALSLLALFASSFNAQAPRELRFDKPLWTSPVEFTSVTGVRVLADGRLIVADPGEKEVRLLSATGQLIRKIGRSGSGPGEYQRPQRLIALRGDSTLVVDPAQRRFLLLGPAGAYVRTEPFPPLIAQHVQHGMQVDGAGKYYVATMPDPGSNAASHVLLWRCAGERLDTIASLKPLTLQHAPQKTTRDGAAVLMWAVVPYAAYDDWVALPSGGVAIVRGADYSIEVITADGKPVWKRTIPFTRVPVTVAERNKVDEAIREQVPKQKPPFANASTAMSSTGELWTERTLATTADHSEWDVTDTRTRAAFRVILPPRTWVMAVTATHVFTIQRDSDDVEHLVAYRR